MVRAERAMAIEGIRLVAPIYKILNVNGASSFELVTWNLKAQMLPLGTRILLFSYDVGTSD